MGRRMQSIYLLGRLLRASQPHLRFRNHGSSITTAGTSVDSDDDNDGYSDLDEGDAYDTATAALCDDGGTLTYHPATRWTAQARLQIWMGTSPVTLS